MRSTRTKAGLGLVSVLLALVLCHLSLAHQAGAIAVRAEVVVAGSIPGPGASLPGVLEARFHGASEADSVSNLSFEISIPGTTEVDLAPGVWTLTAEADQFWCRPEILVVEEGKDNESALTLFPTGTVTGQITVAKHERAPEEVHLYFAPPPGSEAPKRPVGVVACPIRDRSLHCQVPAATLDLRFEAEGSMAHFLWDIRVPTRGTVDVGTWRLRRGSAVIGWLTTERGPGEADRARVTLRPRAAAQEHRSKVREQIGQQLLTARANQRGFFQIHGVGPGEYVLEASKAPFAPVRTTVRVLAHQVTEISDPPLVLRPPQPLEVRIEPPETPTGEPWRLEVEQVDQASARIALLSSDSVPATGVWRHRGVAPGRYRLTVQGRGSERWSTEDVVVEDEAATVVVQMPVVEVRGRVYLGEDPLAATLWFGRKRGPVAIALESDSEGLFGGYLPRPGPWEVDVVAEDPPIERAFQDVEVKPLSLEPGAEIELRLPATLLEGVVVDELGRTIEGAVVTGQSQDEIVPAIRTKSDEKGEFAIHGLPAGLATAVAEDTWNGVDYYSDVVEVELDDPEGSEWVRLVLKAVVKLRGRVVTGDRGVPGARVLAEPFGLDGFPLFPRPTDAGGWFEVGVPASTQQVFLGVAAAGFAYRMVGARLPLQEPLLVPMSQDKGTLVVELPAAVDQGRWSSPRVFVLHQGALGHLGYLLAWAQFNGIRQDDPLRLVIPNMEPGQYTFCWHHPHSRFALVSGGSQDFPCAGGFLSPDAELVVTLPDTADEN